MRDLSSSFIDPTKEISCNRWEIKEIFLRKKDNFYERDINDDKKKKKKDDSILRTLKSDYWWESRDIKEVHVCGHFIGEAFTADCQRAIRRKRKREGDIHK